MLFAEGSAEESVSGKDSFASTIGSRESSAPWGWALGAEDELDFEERLDRGLIGLGCTLKAKLHQSAYCTKCIWTRGLSVEFVRFSQREFLTSSLLHCGTESRHLIQTLNPTLLACTVHQTHS
jgi:hypothetical protein